MGDSPLIGAGTYADSRVGAVSSTGWGEGILRVVMAKSALHHVSAGRTLEQAAAEVFVDLERIGGRAGMILVDARGHAAAAYNTPRMARGLATLADGLRVGIDSDMVPCQP